MLSPRKAIKHHDNNTRRVRIKPRRAARRDRPRKLNTYYRVTAENSYRQTNRPTIESRNLRARAPPPAPLPRVRRRRNRRFNEKCAISRAPRRTKGNCARVDVEVIIEDENSDELTERAARFNGRRFACNAS